jgi:hypothetical protein
LLLDGADTLIRLAKSVIRLDESPSAAPRRFPAEAPPTGMPHYDIHDYCSNSGLLAPTAFEVRACTDREQRAYDELKTNWLTYPQGVKDHCIGSAAGAFFGALRACIGVNVEENKAKRDSHSTD